MSLLCLLLLSFLRAAVSAPWSPNNGAFLGPLFSRSSSQTPKGHEDDDDLQVLRFTEPKSGRPIVLVGCMHYNPQSIKRAAMVVEDLATRQALLSVLVESCPTRWQEASDFRESLARTTWGAEKLYDTFLPNEMRAAAAVAKLYGRPVILGDQPIETTGERLKEYLGRTAMDLANPLGGWRRIAKDVLVAFDVALTSFGLAGGGNGGGRDEKHQLSFAADYLDRKLLLSMPFSFVRYPLSVAIRNPAVVVALTTFFSIVDLGASWAMTTAGITSNGAVDFDGGTTTALSSWAATVLIAAIETIVLCRALMLPILAERDIALASAIVAAANTDSSVEQAPLMVVHKDVIRPYLKEVDARDEVGNDVEKAVVAVVGMAHCNGIKRQVLAGDFRPPGINSTVNK